MSQSRTPMYGRRGLLGDVTGSATKLFTTQYPASDRFKQELSQLRTQGKLKSEDEIQIHRWILSSAERLDIPPAILWCLLFQESRLNHLAGIEGDRAASGIGQFSYYSFYEVNHHLDQYTKDNLALFIDLIGKDVRPIEPKRKELLDPSSYYFIPTAVASSASYLNNRYHHLKQILEKHKIPYDDQLLWFYAAMAYNKGTRSVISFWNDARERGGNALVERLVLENSSFLKSLNEPAAYSRSLKKIWNTEDAEKYSKELNIHMANFKECVLTPQNLKKPREDK